LLVCLGLAGIVGGVGYLHLPNGAQAESTRAGRPGDVQSVSLDGRSLPSNLRSVLSLHAGERFDADKVVRDRNALITALTDLGYLRAHVSDPVVTHDSTGGVFVTYAIAQGPQFVVRTVTVTGVTDKDAGVVTLAAGEIVAADRIVHARQALAERLRVRGKRGAVTANVHPDPAGTVADVELAVTP
jgi:outer membrane protein assembly factor BamA